MNNCLILGFGRSGTSLLGGLLHHSGYFSGNHLHPARESNPKGFFEDVVINRINEHILENYDFSKQYSDFPIYSKPYSPFSPRQGHRWLTYIKAGTNINCNNPEIIQRLINAINCNKVFAYKDPRFSYTLSVWLPHLPGNTRFLCIFRNPVSVAKSVVRECESMDYLKDFYIDQNLVYDLWYQSYTNLLLLIDKYKLDKKVLFIPYEGLINGKYLQNISTFLNAEIHADFIDPELQRNKSKEAIPDILRPLYNKLMEFVPH
jgi:hypothetical protein